jgi:hypothetical protein
MVSLMDILHEAKFMHYMLRLTHKLLEDNPDCRLYFCELVLK